ncbi:hypothetical protein D3C78_911910 [compost metagenome]
MIDDLLTLKAAAIWRCVSRAGEEYALAPATFAAALSRQDATILNIMRACEAALHIPPRAPRHAAERSRRVRPACLGRLDRCRASGQPDAHGGLSDITLHDNQTLEIPVTVGIMREASRRVVLPREGDAHY